MTVCRVQGQGHKAATLQTCHAFHCRENRATDRFRNICYRHRNTFTVQPCSHKHSQFVSPPLNPSSGVPHKCDLARQCQCSVVTGRGGIPSEILTDAECFKSHHAIITHLTHSLFVTLPHLLFFSHSCQQGETVIERSRKYSK